MLYSEIVLPGSVVLIKKQKNGQTILKQEPALSGLTSRGRYQGRRCVVWKVGERKSERVFEWKPHLLWLQLQKNNPKNESWVSGRKQRNQRHVRVPMLTDKTNPKLDRRAELTMVIDCHRPTAQLHDGWTVAADILQLVRSDTRRIETIHCRTSQIRLSERSHRIKPQCRVCRAGTADGTIS